MSAVATTERGESIRKGRSMPPDHVLRQMMTEAPNQALGVLLNRDSGQFQSYRLRLKVLSPQWGKEAKEVRPILLELFLARWNGFPDFVPSPIDPREMIEAARQQAAPRPNVHAKPRSAPITTQRIVAVIDGFGSRRPPAAEIAETGGWTLAEVESYLWRIRGTVYKDPSGGYYLPGRYAVITRQMTEEDWAKYGPPVGPEEAQRLKAEAARARLREYGIVGQDDRFIRRDMTT